MASAPRLIAGLGNPGSEYEGTRHNLGFDVLDLLGERWAVSWRRERGLALWAVWGRDEDAVVLVKPLTYMNRSGEAVAALVRRHGVEPGRTMVVVDDLALPLGTIRIRGKGSAGGHHGLESVEACLHTPGYPRVRIGIGSPAGKDAVPHVLGRFGRAERAAGEESVARAAEAVERWAEGADLERLMGRFNGPAESEKRA